MFDDELIVVFINAYLLITEVNKMKLMAIYTPLNNFNEEEETSDCDEFLEPDDVDDLDGCS